MNIILTIMIFCLIGCSEKDNQVPDVKGPVITSFSPATGSEGTTVTVIGKNFSSTAKSNIITIGGVNTEPVSATWSQLVFNIPIGIVPGSYPINVKVGNVSSNSVFLFIVKEKEAPITDPDVLSFNYSIGTQTIGPSYGFTGNDRLVESAQAILDMGSNILKINLSLGSYDISGRSYSNITALVRDDPSFREVLDMPFTYYFFWTRSHSNWSDGYSSTERMEDSVQIAALTTYLLTKFNNTGKQFFLGHWEGDWYLLPNYDVSYVPSDNRINGMIQWYIARQNAVDEAKRTTRHNNVEVYSYCEINCVVDAMHGLRRVVNYVLPYTYVKIKPL